MKIPKSIQLKIEKRKNDGSFRELVSLENHIDFYSNDYLGLAKIRSKSEASQGSTGSRLISGNFNSTEVLENKLANHFNKDASVLFNSGYDANLGLFSSIPQRGDTVIYDELCHASIRDGIRLSKANSFSFPHNNVEDLKSKLSNSKGTVYVAIESIYSMDGDEGRLKEIVEVCKQYQAYLIVDEAHAGGIYGKDGAGLVSLYNLDDLVFAKILTFGKTFGSHGAIVLSRKEIRDYLINFARSFIYTTAISPHAQDRIEFVVTKLKSMVSENDGLKANIELFKKQMSSSKYNLIKSESPIQSLIIPGNIEVKAVAKKCLDAGIAVKAILSPTVRKGEERIRICLHSYNSADEIHKLVECLS